ncbi:MAG: hypothetical protein EOO08_10100 [Chitinophagaceae bacterium]|nr:MAG: hypothetical protein EOO08_10100 [Chitinophagaceae bacterium]
MFHRIQLYDLRIAEMIQFLAQLRTQFDDARHLPPTVVALLADLKSVEADIDQLYKRDTAKQLTEQAVAQDGLRDQHLSCLYQLVAIHANDPDAAMAAAAARIGQVTQKYGTTSHITKLGLNAETAVIGNLLADLARPVHADDLALLGFGRWLAALKAANTAVNDTLLERASLNADRELPFKMKDKRSEARRLYAKLLDKCPHFQEESANGEPWPDLERKVNAITGDYDRIISIRKGKAASEQEAEARINSEPGV